MANLYEFRLGGWGHTAIDVISGISDFFSFGSAGPVIDAVHGLIYMYEYNEEEDETEKAILLMQGMVTFASILLPAAAQAAAPVIKNSIKSIMKGGKASPKAVAKIKAIFSKAKPFVKSVGALVRDRDVDKLAEAIEKKTEARGKAARGYAYLCIIGKKFGIPTDAVLGMPESLAEKASDIVEAISGVDLSLPKEIESA